MVLSAHITRIRVRYGDTDKSGAVYHGNYIIWFEGGRVEALRSVDMPYAEVEEAGIQLPVVELQVRYRKPALYDQLLEVRTTIGDLTRTRVRFEYQLMLSDDSSLLAEATTVHPFVGPTGRVVRLDRHSNIWERMQVAARKLHT